MKKQNFEKLISKDEILSSYMPFFKKFDVWLVGGYLRDLYFGKISTDRDLVVADAESFARAFAQYSKGHFVELDGENHIYRVVLEDKINYFDITQPLESSLKKDIKRRDFTINSLFYNLTTSRMLGETDDFENRIIRTTDVKNLNDDPLRMLRAFRFASLTDFEIAEDIIDFIKKNKVLIHDCAQERISYEILKFFSGNYAAKNLYLMHESGFLREIFPFVDEVEKIPPNSHHHLNLLKHSFETVNQIELAGYRSEHCALLKLAAFMHDIGKPSTWKIEPEGRHRFINHDVLGAELATKILKQMKFSKKHSKYISTLIKNHIYPSALMSRGYNEKAMLRFVRKIDLMTPDLIMLAKSDRLCARGPLVSDEMIDNNINNLDNLLKFYENTKESLKPLPKLLDGNEICALLNIEPSEKLGNIINALKEAQLNSVVLTKEDAVKFISSLRLS